MSSPTGGLNPALTVTLAGVPSPARYASGGPAPERGTVNRFFFEAVEEFDGPSAFMRKVGDKWDSIPHRTVLECVRRTAFGLRALGIGKGDRVAILSENRLEWAIADYACITSCITDVPVYSTLPAEHIPHILNDSGACAVFVSTAGQAQKIAEIRDEIPNVRHVIGFDATKADGCDYTLTELQKLGEQSDTPEAARAWRDAALAVEPDALLTLIYTSGTTGAPKGVVLTHDNLHSNCLGARYSIPLEGGDVALSFLPLSHVFERMGAYYLFSRGVPIAYAESIDTVAANMLEVRPSVMLSVPRLYEKIYARVLENAVSSGALKKKIFFWAKQVGESWAKVRLAGREPGAWLAFRYSIAAKLVFSKLKERTGGRMRVFVSGGAPLAPDIALFFYSAGLPILEGYGLTETSPVISANTFQDFRIGTVGKPIPGVEVKIASDGEILTRGPHIMKGYYMNPEATAATIDSDGWLHTGDIGELQDGFLRITDRKKDLIVTAGGKNIAPQPIENQVRMNKYVSQVVMLGDKHKFPILLVVPEWDQLEKWAKAQNLSWSSRAQLLQMPTIREKLEREVTSELHGLARYETPKKFAWIEHEFSIDNGELTPKLSVKRRFVENKYRNEIAALYEEG